MLNSEQRAKLEADRDAAVSAAMDLFDQGDVDGARQKLFDLGISFDRIGDYFAAWSAP